MPNFDVILPVTSAPTVRLALGVSWVRPGVAGIGGTLNPAFLYPNSFICFEGSEE